MHALRFYEKVLVNSAALSRCIHSHLQTQHRFFIDAPIGVGDSIPMMDTAATVEVDTTAGSSSSISDASYVYPLDITAQKIKIYGETSNFAVEDSNRVITSNRLHSYDPSVLSAELRLQDSWTPLSEGNEEAAIAAKDSLSENDAVMKEGRNKQGAAGAAAVAAAMLESRRAVDGIALIPGHPLPVVFPRPDDLPPPLRFIQKFGTGAARQTSSKGRKPKLTLAEEENDEDRGIYSEVMESATQVEAHSFQKSFVFQVRILDELNRPAKVKGFHHFSELAPSVTPMVNRGLVNANFSTPTLMQSAVIPLLMMNKDIVCVAPRTSGRTYSIAIRALTVLSKVLSSGAPMPDTPPNTACPIILVVCPSTEVAQRMSSAFCVLGGEEVALQVIHMGKEQEKQNEDLKTKPCHVLLATPNRLDEAIAAGNIQLKNVHFAAAFLADEILGNETTKVSLFKVMNAIKKNEVPHQLTVWCSNVTETVEKFARKYLAVHHMNTVIVQKQEKMNANVRQILYALKDKEERLDCIWKLYDSHAILKREQVLIFCLFQETAETLARELCKLLDAPSSIIGCLHSGLGNRKQRQIVSGFQKGEIRILVTTDTGAKKVDVPDLEHVVNYDLAPTQELLARRTRHVGQSGRSASIHTFLVPEDSAVPLTAKFISEQTGKPLSREIMDLVERTEAAGMGDTWTTPIIRFNDHIGLSTRWRVRGHLDDPPSPVLPKGQQGNGDTPTAHLGRARSTPKRFT